MSRFRTILFAADFSENSKEAFPRGLLTGRRERGAADRVPRRSTDSGRGGAGLQGTTIRPFHERPKRRSPPRVAAGENARVLLPGSSADVEYRTNEGIAAEEILRMADEVGADLIVIGTHGSTGLRHLLAGSVATAVMHGAHCPVLAMRIARPLKHTERIRVILHPTDFSDVSEAALHVARSLARDAGARLVILHVYPFNELAVPEDPRDFRAALEQLREHTDGPDLKHPVETRLSKGDAADVILGIAGEINCDLIVMGTHGRTGLRRLLMGNVAESVVPEASCPVLVVKIPEAASPPTSDRPSTRSATLTGQAP